MIYSNVDGFLNKKDELLSRIEESKPKIIALTETKAKNCQTFIEAEYSIPNYVMFCNLNPRRGVVLYVEKELNARECDEVNAKLFEESVFCTFDSADKERILLGCIYRSPNTSSEENDNKLFDMLKSEEVAKYDKVCIMGDFNFPAVRWDGVWAGEKNNNIKEHILESFLCQKVIEPTRRRLGQRPTLDDWVLVSEPDLISDISHLDPVGKSDHDVLSFQLYIAQEKVMEEVKYNYDLKKGDYQVLRNIVKDYDWSVLSELSVNDAWCCIKTVLQEGMEKSIPKVKKSSKKNTKPRWMDKKSVRQIKKKYNLYKRYLRTKSGQDYQKYIEARNMCTKALKRTRKEYEKQIASESKVNPKKFWKYVQERMKTNTGISTLKKADGTYVVDDLGKAEILNDYFSSVFTREDVSDTPTMAEGCYSDGKFLSEVRVTPLAIKKNLSDLDANKAQGPDLIPSKVLKELSEELSNPLCYLFNKSLEDGILPDDWKTAEVTAIFKKGTKSDPGNYRPVSLTCVTCKVLESLVRDSIVSYFTENNLYAECQHGFRKKRSCVTQLIEVMEDLTKLADEGHDVDIIYCDFRKAFDAVPHERLLLKLSSYGICSSVLSWISAFLAKRTQRVRIGKSYSSQAPVLSGIPQGSILGPILFTIFINDLPEVVRSLVKIFADDTKIYNKASNSAIIQEDIHKLQEWSNKWKLFFNVSKCKVLHTGKKNPNSSYVMTVNDDVEKIKECEEEKDLGVTFDCDLSFDPHIQRVISKGNQMIGIVKRSFSFLDNDTFLKLYKAFVRPHVEYANVIWCPYLKRQSKAIEGVQRRATKLLKEWEGKSYDERLRYLHLHSLKGRRLRGDLIQTYKIINGVVDVDKNKIFSFSKSSITRNNAGKIFVQHCRTNKRKYCFSNRVANHWNTLPTNIKFAPTVNRFKNYLDNNPKFSNLFYDYD